MAENFKFFATFLLLKFPTPAKIKIQMKFNLREFKMFNSFSRLSICGFFLLLSFSILAAQDKAGKDRFAAYRELYAENEGENSSERSALSMDFSPFPSSGSTFSGMGVPGFGQAAPTMHVTAKVLVLPTEDKPGELEIAAQIPAGFKIYSLTQESGGPFPTKIHLADGIQIDGKVDSVPAPKSEKDEAVWGDITIESHQDLVKWNVKFTLKDGTAIPSQLSGSVEAQMCDANSCLPPKKFPFTAPIPRMEQALSSAEISEEKVLPDSRAADLPGESSVSEAAVPEISPAPAENLNIENENQQKTAEILPENTESTQTGDISNWEAAPESAQQAKANVSEVAEETLSEESGTPDEISSRENFVWSENESAADYSLAIILLMAYLGGLILNLMPCVLPVIAPKLHSFVRQAGEARVRVFLLNVSYTLGLLTVLWLLAALSRIADLMTFLKGVLPADFAAKLPEMQNMGWGQQFTYPGFVIFMIALVFVMGLSFLGVWEIPIPGMISSGRLGKMQKKEGFLGAYCMGILTTLLATPCVGPYLGPVFGWVMTQPVWISFLTFSVIGLGLGTPYLLIGAFPFMIRFLPKPGEWMETLKEVMGFFFLGTVVWLFYVLPGRFTVPTLGLLVALWFACWLIGKTTLSGASRESVLAAWVCGIIFTVLVGFTLFSMDLSQVQDGDFKTTDSVEDGIPWEKFSQKRVEELQNERKIIFIDFTARWCATCQTNTKFAIETPKVEEFIRSNEIVPLLADWTEPSEEIEQYLKLMKRNSIPLIVIWVPGKEQPILLDGLVSESKLLSVLQFSVDAREEAERSSH